MTKPSIKNEQEYAAALEAIERLLDAEPVTPEGEKFEALAK
jgi:antitoxin component HigA of HigAB toxin-antitoxin module